MHALAAVFPMHWTWRLALLMVSLGCAVAAVMCLAELTGVVASGSLIGDTSDAERWIAVIFCLGFLPFGITALQHSRLVVGEHELSWLGFGLICGPRTATYADVQRWGTAARKRQGRTERMLILGMRDGTQQTVKLSMYTGIPTILDMLRERLGDPAPATITMTGVRFDG